MWPRRNYLPLSYENMNKLSKATTTNTEEQEHQSIIKKECARFDIGNLVGRAKRARNGHAKRARETGARNGRAKQLKEK